MSNANELKQYNAVAYLRISKEDGDKEESDSISNQRDLIRDFVKDRPDIILPNEMEMIDDGYSGASFTRPSFLRMIEYIKAKKVNCIIVKDDNNGLNEKTSFKENEVSKRYRHV